MHQVDPGDFNGARPLWQYMPNVATNQGWKLLTVHLSGTGKNYGGQVNIFGTLPKEMLTFCLFTLIHISGTVGDRQKQWWTGRSFPYFSGGKPEIFCNIHFCNSLLRVRRYAHRVLVRDGHKSTTSKSKSKSNLCK